ncbi:MAG: aminopeptidase P family protein [Armatimonadetes bacterium]|nr:aminopeptidase P family protein [Anaerolineae bacterium]
MKSDIDRLMAARGFDAIVVLISDAYSPYVDYLVGRAALSNGMVFKDWQAPPVLVVNPMERDEAAATGCRFFTYDELGQQALLDQYPDDPLMARVMLWGKCLQQFGTPNGRVGVYGIAEAEYALALVAKLEETFPQYDFVGESGTTLFAEAAMTKDADELRRLRSVGDRTSAVVRATWEFIAGHRANADELVVKRDGTSLTIGDVKRFVRRALLDRDLEEREMIFAQGRDAGVPHNRGQDAQALRLGASIIFDLFPRELGGGYFHDVTRTWCIGYAPDEVREAYHAVSEAFDVALELYAVNRPVSDMQLAVQASLEARHHPTSRSHPGTLEGYVHGLGHGVGLAIHEGYNITHRNQSDTFQVGNVITIEPGLYYPERGFGVRLEDTVYAAPDGRLVSLTDVPKELVLPLRG